ncbi:hypothetical protein LY90DRAFT_499142 [Neocallimastix californiae]|uniref:Uncharacterized protein n=1 Tax=Neocallimastix californiae TaxID=1754190 RepID=A0A1Y2FMJ9_9FUNG|nr:hypothetical protein LY90DRAFT_499142 [Neocallimastix californiae]|eukprot:ORY85212.1 hypothetical protein LY90DRAFT_499142 [Neocallimastix californiae]
MDPSKKYEILSKLYELYTSQNVFQLSNYTCETAIDKDKVISKYRNQAYVDNLRDSLRGMTDLQIIDRKESFNFKYIKRILYKENESIQGKIKKLYKFNGFSVDTEIYLVTTTIGTKNDKTTQDILDRMEEKEKEKEIKEKKGKGKGKDEEKDEDEERKKEKRKKMFMNNFSVKPICDLRTGKEQIITLDANNFVQKKYSENKDVARNDIYYYYNMLYDRRLNDFNQEFVSCINFYCSSEDKNTVKEVGFEEAGIEKTEDEDMAENQEIEEIGIEEARIEETEDEDMAENQEIEEAGIEETEDEDMAENQEIEEIGIEEARIEETGIEEAGIEETEDEDMAENQKIEEIGIEEARIEETGIEEAGIEETEDQNMAKNQKIEEAGIEEATQLVCHIYSRLNEEEFMIGGIYLKNNIYHIKANNNNVIGEMVFYGNGCAISTNVVMTFNECNNVIQQCDIGKIVILGEREYLTDIENNIIGEFYFFDGNRSLYLNDMESLLAKYLMENIYVPVSLENIDIDGIHY